MNGASWEVLEKRMENNRDKREDTVTTYDSFRQQLDRYDPALAEGNRARIYSNQEEWDLYLKPDSIFDRQMRILFSEHKERRVDFKVMLIRHKKDMLKLKRIEGIAFGEVTILWSDASG